MLKIQGLFDHAIDLVKNCPEIYNQRNGTAVQCACMYLDSTWQNNLILTHAALGGGTNEVKWRYLDLMDYIHILKISLGNTIIFRCYPFDNNRSCQ